MSYQTTQLQLLPSILLECFGGMPRYFFYKFPIIVPRSGGSFLKKFLSLQRKKLRKMNIKLANNQSPFVCQNFVKYVRHYVHQYVVEEHLRGCVDLLVHAIRRSLIMTLCTSVHVSINIHHNCTHNVVTGVMRTALIHPELKVRHKQSCIPKLMDCWLINCCLID